MKKNRILSALLCLSLAAGLVIPGLPAYAEGEGESSNSGMELSKTAVANGDGTYTITLEAYATGQKVISQVKKDVPTDIVLVLDQSGSMKEPIGTVSFSAITNQRSNSQHYNRRHNGGSANLWHKLDDGSYVSVSVTVKEVLSYTKITNGRNNSTYDRATNYWENQNNLYALVKGEYKKVTLTREYNYENYDYTYVYSLPNGEIVKSEGRYTSPTFTGIDGDVLYLASVDDSKTVYTYTYVDADGNTQTIATSTGANTTFPTTLYQRNINQNAGGSRIDALTSAVTTFTNSVAEKAKGEDGVLGTDDDINHRVAVVGYASRADSNNPWINTELFIGATQHNYNVDASNYYNQAFQNMNTQAGQDNVAASIGALGANGATYTNYGLEMANGILDAYKLQPNEKRNRVIVLFTDGYPGKNADDFNQTAANAALTQATTAKNAGVSVYSVGIFSGADASSAGNKDGSNTEAANWFMQQVSSNNGTPQTPSYYLSAADSATLNSIFKQIASNIESGGSSTTLNKEAVIKDIISPAFTLPEGATTSDITLETYQCTGKNGDVYIWEENETAMGATAAVNGDQVSVTGFDFAENYVGTVTENGKTTYRGNKLVISFTVSPEAGFLGGNEVYTNTSAGIYENGSAENPLLTFDRPTVNVPIKAVTVTAKDKNVYLKGEVTADQLKDGAEISVGDVELDLSKATDADKPYGLDPWQTEYVDITVEIKDAKGNVISDKLDNLTEDTTYTVEVTVAPNKPGTTTPEKGAAATAKTGVNDPAANIYVYKPELTYKDSEVFYGDNLPTNFDTYNRTATQWKHGTSEPTADMGTAPDLAITYKPEASKIDENNKIASTEDIQVAATVKIGDTDVTGSTTFLHTACDPACGWNETTQGGSPAFLLHVKTATLTITKTDADGNKNEGFIFNVTGPNNLTFRVSVKDNGTVTITGLPLGEYTVTEDEGWSWRYKAENSGKVELTETAYEGSVTIKNAKDKSYLLDGSAYAQNNSVRLAAGN